ncbi:MAG TPA: 3-oxoacyl-ACP reductase FabG [Gammaproteobacteria bacterium]|nr:3-oxoacyl-ACP reductase FabG [Gammaproteobacteria bacterium]
MTHTALVTGASGGIGQAIARRLARDGTHVWLHYHRNQAGAEQAAEAIRADGGRADTVGFDVGDWARSREALEALLEQGTVFDILVHNAGIVDDAPFPGMDEPQWRRVIDTDLNGFFHVTRPLVMAMMRRRWGRIVAISSIAALHGNRGQSNYAAAKAGLIGASRSLARELASRGICVNVVAPGFVDTAMIDAIPAELVRDKVPMQRAGRPEEIADVVAFLCSEGVSYMTGEVLNVSGGII